MCRLYGFRATEETKVECTLVHAQNALMVQSQADLKGYSHANGWGIATYENHLPHIERQAWAAYHGEHFRRAAARIYSRTVLAHVRRATVGLPSIENTHPFVEGAWALIHNGTVPHFEQVKPRMMDAIAPDRQRRILGTTDSEHVFHLFMTLREAAPASPVQDSLRTVIAMIAAWCHEIDQEAKIGLNLIVSNGSEFVGSRFGRGLYMAERSGILDCEICGFPHVHHHKGQAYHATVVASEPVTHEAWSEVPADCVYTINADAGIQVLSL